MHIDEAKELFLNCDVFSYKQAEDVMAKCLITPEEIP